MSTSSLRGLSARAAGPIRPHLSTRPTATAPYGRTAAYRRIAAAAAADTRRSIEAARASRRDVASVRSPPFAPSSRFVPQTIAPSATSVRHVSFRELREERAKQRAGEAQGAETAQVASEAESAASTSTSTSDEAEAAFAQARREAERQWAKEEEEEEEERQRQRQRQQQQQEHQTNTEGAGAGEGEQANQTKKEHHTAPPPPPPPHGNKTPWQVFTDTLQAEFKASKEWEESTKQLSGSINDFTQNPNVQKARSAYSKAADAASTATGKAFVGTAGAIGRGAAWTWQTPVVKGIRAGAGAVGAGVEKVTRPVRQTEAYKSVKDTIDDGASQRYGGWMEKEERRKRREEYERKMGRSPREVWAEDPNAGTKVTVHKDAAWKESWRQFKDNSPVMQRLFGLGSTYRESENPLISTARSVSDRIAGFFAENETARVIKKFRDMDPSFRLEPFLNEMRSYILPEVLEAYVQGDVDTLKVWLSAAQFQVYAALMQQYTTAGLKSDGKILDIRGVDVLSARMLDPGEIPVFVIMCRTQEVHVYRNQKTGDLAAGMEDKVQQVTYAIGVTRVPEDVANPETRGWKLIELQKSARDYL